MDRIVLTITRYPAVHLITALHSMPFFRLPLSVNKRIGFYKLMGCGKNGVFSLQADWHQYAVFTAGKTEDTPLPDPTTYEEWKKTFYGSFISRWWRLCRCETWTIVLEPILSHGTWSGQSLTASGSKPSDEEPVAVLTRATIRPRKAWDFWKSVLPVQRQMKDIPGLTFSVGLGELPLFRQATFSIWQNETQMKQFAYARTRHKDVVKQTREKQWYSEEMFTRFRVLQTAGTIFGKNPFPLQTQEDQPH